MSLALSIKNLSKTYANGTQALHGADLEVEEGDFFALLGPNGAGKSTIIGIICSLINKSSGQVSVFGHDLDKNSEAVKSSIGLVPQEFNFNQFEPVIEIVANQAGYYGIGRKLAYERAEKYLRQLELWDKRNELARELSGGMKRRLMIARALVHEPKLLILDEPTAGVDIEIRRSMWAFLRKVNDEGTTIILTTHYLEEAENLCRHIAIINNGKTITSSKMSDLVSKLHEETFIFDLESEIENEFSLDGFKWQKVDANTVEVTLSEEQDLTQLFNYLSTNNIKVGSMRNKSNRLEEMFMNLVEQGEL